MDLDVTNSQRLPEQTTLFRYFVATLWERRFFVLIATLVVTLLMSLAIQYFSYYTSEGFFQFGGVIPANKDLTQEKKLEPKPGIALADFKRFAAAYGTAERFDQFTSVDKQNDAATVQNLRRALFSREGLLKFIEPVFTFTKLDVKDLVDSPKDGGSVIVGLKISANADTPQGARDSAVLLGRYVIDTIIYIIFSDELKFKDSEVSAKLTKLDNRIIENNVKLRDFSNKASELKGIISRYPRVESQSANQVVSVTPENAQYLSPMTHLMATEVLVADAKEEIARAEREQAENLLLREYYRKVVDSMKNLKSGEAILRGLDAVKAQIFKDKNMNDDATRKIHNLISIENQTSVSLYLEKSRFIAGPTLPGYRSVRLSLVWLGSFLVALFASVLVVFLRKFL